MKQIKYVYVYQHGQIVKMPYWEYIMQRAKEHRIRNTSRSDDSHPSQSEVEVCGKKEEVTI